MVTAIKVNGEPGKLVEEKKTNIELINDALASKVKLKRSKQVLLLLFHTCGAPFSLTGGVIQVPFNILCLIGLPFQKTKRNHAFFYITRAFILTPLDILWGPSAQIVKMFSCVVGIVDPNKGAKLYVKGLQFDNLKLKLDLQVWNLSTNKKNRSSLFTTYEVKPTDARFYLGKSLCEQLRLQAKGVEVQQAAHDAVKEFITVTIDNLPEAWSFDEEIKLILSLSNEEAKNELLEKRKQAILDSVSQMSDSSLASTIVSYKTFLEPHIINIFPRYYNAISKEHPDLLNELEQKINEFSDRHKLVVLHFTLREKDFYEAFLSNNKLQGLEYFELLEICEDRINELVSYKRLEVIF